MIIRKEQIAAVLPATTPDDGRYFTNAMQVEPSGRVVATNGHVLIVAENVSPIPDEDYPIVQGAPFHTSPAGPVLLAADIAKRLIAATPKKSTIPALQGIQFSTNGTPTTITACATDMQAPMVTTINTADQGQFPAYDRCIPADSLERPSVRVCLAVDVLETLIKAAKAIDRDNPKITLDIPIGDKDAPIAKRDNPTGYRELASQIKFSVSSKNFDVKVYGVAMPCRV